MGFLLLTAWLPLSVHLAWVAVFTSSLPTSTMLKMAKRAHSSLTKPLRGRGSDEPNGQLCAIAPGKAFTHKNLTAAGVVGGFLAEEQTSLASDLPA